MTIQQIVPVPEDLLALNVEAVGGILLKHLVGMYPNEPSAMTTADQPHRYNFFNNLRNSPAYSSAGGQVNAKVNLALMEAWSWLEKESLLAVYATTQGGELYFLTRRGREVERVGLASYQNANLLPHSKLHPAISEKVYPTFLRGDYDTAVFQAFREVEVSVRTKAGYAAESIGVPMMRNAFRPAQATGSPGPLSDTSVPFAEQDGMMSLFAGAIAVYKNPQSHRSVLTDPVNAAEVIIFASHLLRVIDKA